MWVYPFNGEDQTGDTHGGVLNLRSEVAHGTTGGEPTDRRVQRRWLDCSDEEVQRLEGHFGVGKDLRVGGVQSMAGKPLCQKLFAIQLVQWGRHQGDRSGDGVAWFVAQDARDASRAAI